MVNIAQIVSWVIILAATALGAWIMNMFFGIVGVILFVVMTGGIVAVVGYFAGGSSGGSANVSSGRRSKGARQRED